MVYVKSDECYIFNKSYRIICSYIDYLKPKKISDIMDDMKKYSIDKLYKYIEKSKDLIKQKNYRLSYITLLLFEKSMLKNSGNQYIKFKNINSFFEYVYKQYYFSDLMYNKNSIFNERKIIKEEEIFNRYNKIKDLLEKEDYYSCLIVDFSPLEYLLDMIYKIQINKCISIERNKLDLIVYTLYCSSPDLKLFFFSFLYFLVKIKKTHKINKNKKYLIKYTEKLMYEIFDKHGLGLHDKKITNFVLSKHIKRKLEDILCNEVDKPSIYGALFYQTNLGYALYPSDVVMYDYFEKNIDEYIITNNVLSFITNYQGNSPAFDVKDFFYEIPLLILPIYLDNENLYDFFIVTENKNKLLNLYGISPDEIMLVFERFYKNMLNRERKLIKENRILDKTFFQLYKFLFYMSNLDVEMYDIFQNSLLSYVYNDKVFYQLLYICIERYFDISFLIKIIFKLIKKNKRLDKYDNLLFSILFHNFLIKFLDSSRFRNVKKYVCAYLLLKIVKINPTTKFYYTGYIHDKEINFKIVNERYANEKISKINSLIDSQSHVNSFKDLLLILLDKEFINVIKKRRNGTITNSNLSRVKKIVDHLKKYNLINFFQYYIENVFRDNNKIINYVKVKLLT